MRNEDEDNDLAELLQAALDDVTAGGNLTFTPPETNPDDPRHREEPPPSPSLRATFKWEDTADDGEDIGPLIVLDPETQSVVWESSDWIRLSEARRLAEAKGWQFHVDGAASG